MLPAEAQSITDQRPKKDKKASIFSHFMCEKTVDCEDCMRVACASFKCAGCFKGCAHAAACLLQKTWNRILARDGNEELWPHYFQVVAHEGPAVAWEWRVGHWLLQLQIAKLVGGEKDQIRAVDFVGFRETDLRMGRHGLSLSIQSPPRLIDTIRLIRDHERLLEGLLETIRANYRPDCGAKLLWRGYLGTVDQGVVVNYWPRFSELLALLVDCAYTAPSVL